MDKVREIDFRYAPASRWACIGRPDDPYKSLVNEEGALMYGYEPTPSHHGTFRFKRLIAFALQTDRKPIAITQDTETARIPLVKTTIQYPKAVLELSAIGHQHDGDRRTDLVMWSVRAADGVDEFLTGLWIEAQELGRRFVPATIAPGHRIYVVEESSVPRGTFADNFQVQEEDETVEPPGPLAFISVLQRLEVASAFDHGPASGLRTTPALVRSGEPMQGALLFPLNHDDVEGLDWDWARQALEDERRFWTGHELQALTVELPDGDVADMITACARNILQAREIKDGIPEFQIGPTVYRGLWVVDGHFLLEAAQYLGHAEEASHGIDALLRRRKPNGAIAEMEFHIKETGIALATLVRQCELLGDFGQLEGLWPTIRRAVHYIESLREASKERGPEAPEYGLMPPTFGDGGLGGMRPEYTSALWTLAGLKGVAGAARRLGYNVDAEHFRAALDDLMRAFREHAERDMQTLPDGTPYLPMLKPGSGEHYMIPDHPATPEPWQRVNPGTATWAFAHAIYPGEVFPPDDPLVQNFCHLLDLLDDEEGIPAGTGWLPYRAVWPYAASFYAHVWLYVGRPDKAVDYLYAFANHAAPTRAWREEQSLRDTHHGQIIGDMPHNWASAEFIRLVRHLLVFERGDVLELLPGLPPEWLAPGKLLCLERTPTRFGPVSLSLQVDANGHGQLEVTLDTDWPRRPDRCVLHVPRAAKMEIGEVSVNSQTIALADDGTVELPITDQVIVRGSFR